MVFVFLDYFLYWTEQSDKSKFRQVQMWTYHWCTINDYSNWSKSIFFRFEKQCSKLFLLNLGEFELIITPWSPLRVVNFLIDLEFYTIFSCMFWWNWKPDYCPMWYAKCWLADKWAAEPLLLGYWRESFLIMFFF